MNLLGSGSVEWHAAVRFVGFDAGRGYSNEPLLVSMMAVCSAAGEEDEKLLRRKWILGPKHASKANLGPKVASKREVSQSQ